MFLITIYYISFDIFIFHPSDGHEFIYMYQFYPRLFFLENVSLYLYCSKSIKIIKSSFFSPTAKIKFHVEIFFYECMTLKTSKLLILYLTSIRTISFIKSLLQWHSPVTLNLRLPSVCSFFGEKNPD